MSAQAKEMVSVATISRPVGRLVFGLLLALSASAMAADTSSRPGKPGERMEILCHRGACLMAPENTLAAARKAIELGADYVEVDVRTTADGVMVDIHDPTVNRTTDGEGRVNGLTAKQIASVEAGTWFKPAFKGERVPELRALLEWIRGKAGVYFDVKDADLPALIKLVYELKMERSSFFWFGNAANAARFRQLDPALIQNISVKDIEGLRRVKAESNPGIVQIDIEAATPEFMSEARKLGVKVMVFYVGRDKAVFRRILESGAQMVGLNDLEAFLEVERAVYSERAAAGAGSAAKSPPPVSLTLIPPSPVTDRIELDIRGAVRNGGDEARTFDVAVYLDVEKTENCLHRESLDVAGRSAAGIGFRWPTKDRAGEHRIIMVAKCGEEVLRAIRLLAVRKSDIRSTRRVDGAWCSFNLPEMREGLIYDPVLRQMTDEQWAETMRGMHGIGMDILVMQESVHWHRHNTDGQPRYSSNDFGAKAFYPSGLFTNRMPMAARDPIEAVFSEGDRQGMHVFAGVGLFAWFDFTPASLAWHKRVADELWARYGHHPSFYGWYISEEKNGGLGNAAERAQIVEFFKDFTPYVRRLAPDKPVMLAPNCYNVRGAEEIYRKLLPNVDILCPFAFHRMPRGQTGEEAATILQSLCDEAGAHLWMDMEVFLFDRRGALIPRPIDGLVSDLLRFPNFEKIICYQYPGLLTAPDASIRPGGDEAVKLYEDYRRYLRDGPPRPLSHAAWNKAVALAAPPDAQYPGRGAAGLVDGRAGLANYRDPQWMGFSGADLDATVDLGSAQDVTRIGVRCLQFVAGGIYLPREITAAVSEDGSRYADVATVRPSLPSAEPGPAVETLTATPLKVRGRYVRVRAANSGSIPAGRPGAGKPAWLFVDEIVVNPEGPTDR